MISNVRNWQMEVESVIKNVGLETEGLIFVWVIKCISLYMRKYSTSTISAFA